MDDAGFLLLLNKLYGTYGVRKTYFSIMLEFRKILVNPPDHISDHRRKKRRSIVLMNRRFSLFTAYQVLPNILSKITRLYSLCML